TYCGDKVEYWERQGDQTLSHAALYRLSTDPRLSGCFKRMVEYKFADIRDKLIPDMEVYTGQSRDSLRSQAQNYFIDMVQELHENSLENQKTLNQATNVRIYDSVI